jgi:hypothetical protein
LTRELKPQEIQPWAKALQKERVDTFQSPLQACLPLGPVNSVGTIAQEIKIVRTPNLIVILYGDLTYRQVHLDGRSLEKDPNPSWMGYSVGHWEGDTLVVESNGYNDRTWLDPEGHPHSEGLLITERFRRNDLGHMDLSVTFKDPAVYARPMRMDTTMQAVADTEMIEYVCAENEKDHAHLIGKASDDPTVELSTSELSKFVGTYLARNPFGPGFLKFDVTLTGSELTVDTPLTGPLPFHPVGKTSFSSRGAVVSFVDENGGTVMILSVVEGELKAVRKP